MLGVDELRIRVSEVLQPSECIGQAGSPIYGIETALNRVPSQAVFNCTGNKSHFEGIVGEWADPRNIGIQIGEAIVSRNIERNHAGGSAKVFLLLPIRDFIAIAVGKPASGLLRIRDIDLVDVDRGRAFIANDHGTHLVVGGIERQPGGNVDAVHA